MTNIPINNNTNLDNISEINELKNLLNEEKNKNNILINENNFLKNIISKLKAKISLLENDVNFKNMEIRKLQTQIEEKYSITTIKPGEKIMSINFVSMGSQDIGHYSLECKNTDIFIKLEERLYNDYPQFKNFETYFEVKAKRIKRFKTLDENNIKNHDVINLFIIEEN